MRHVHLTDPLFRAAQDRAADAGYASVDEYVADIVVRDLSEDDKSVSGLFTPQRVAELERISADIKAGGKTYSLAQAEEHFESRRKIWLASHAH
jgi:hypothetical protein